jgi:replicative DNA helicase
MTAVADHPAEPCSLEAERAVLGAVLLGNGRVLGPLVGFLKPGHFYWSEHRLIWRAMVDLHEAGRDVDHLTLSEFMGPGLDEVGGRQQIDLLATCTPNWSHFLDYGQIVHRKAQFRRRLRALHLMRDAALAEDEEGYKAAWEKAR